MRSQPAPILFQENRHPRLFFGEGDIAVIRQKTQAGIGAHYLSELLARCETYCDASSPDYVDTDNGRPALLGEGQWASPAAGPLQNLAFAALLTEDTRWLKKAKDILSVVSSGEPACTAIPVPFGMKYDSPEAICVSNMTGYLPIAYDILYPWLDEMEKNQIETYIRNRIVTPYRDTFLANPLTYTASLGVNPVWHELYTYIWSLAAIYDPARPEDQTAMQQAVALVRRAIHQGVDDTGVIGEGPGYGRHDVYRWVSSAEIFYRAGIADFWTEEPRFTKMMDHWTHLLLPGRNEIMNRCDASRTFTGDVLWALLLHAHHTGDTVAQYTWEALSGRSSIESLGSLPGLPGALGFYFLWDDEERAAQSPDDAAFPRTKAPGAYGVHIMRTGWQKEDTFFSLLSAGRTKDCFIHQHADAGHFCLFSLGEAFSIETGYGDIQAKHHSVMLPNGKEPPHSPEGFDHTWVGGHNHAFASGTHADYACVDIAQQWDCYWNYRHGLLVRAPGTDPYVLLLDNCNYRSDFAFYDWQINTEPGNRIELDANEERAVIHGRENRLECVWAYPAANEYPKPHTLALSDDEQESSYIHHGKALGIGTRPRLHARLEGYNGLLLSALLPRRKGAPSVQCERLHGTLQFGLRLNHGDLIDTIVANPLRGLSIAGITADAALALLRHDTAGNLLYAMAIDSYALDYKNQTLQPRQGEPETMFEWNQPM